MTGSRRQHPAAELLLFVVAITVAAFLIFLVQPIVGKRILPWFGGAPGVWTLCLAFYQTTLFLGYAYAHLLIRFASPGVQLAVHASAMAVAIGLLPVLPGAQWQPQASANPSVRILLMLAANVAMPFVVLASTGPLVQAWFARRQPQRSPYPLYAFSNLGSLAALLAYPFVIEPRFGLSQTGDFWSVAFVVAACLVLACATLAWRSGIPGTVPDWPDETRNRSDGFATAQWLLLSACAVVLLMGVTNKLCTDIASGPFLWILPLATYLVTFVVCFASEANYRRTPFVMLAVLALALTVGAGYWAMWIENRTRIALRSPPVQIASYCLLLFSFCMILHGELYRLRPPARRLTAFYLCVAGGGALGGIFVGILAPIVFTAYHEFTLGLIAAFLLFLTACARDPTSLLHSAPPRWRWAAIAAGIAGVIGLTAWDNNRGDGAIQYQERSFFGVYRVAENTTKSNAQRQLFSGTTLHGVQFPGKWKKLPTSYYGRATGLGLVLGRADPSVKRRFGVVGLGVGTAAAYTHPGDVIRFYEIDPVVVGIARDTRYFEFLSNSPAEVEMVVGDARLSIAGEQARGERQSFDYLIVDAFNSDAVPVHLLTVEAFNHYAAALAPGGLIAVHVSSRHFDLRPLVTRAGLELGLYSLQIGNLSSRRYQSKSSLWVWLSPDRERIDEIAAQALHQNADLGLDPTALKLQRNEPGDEIDAPVWTDDYSDLFGVLRHRNPDPSIGAERLW